MNKDVAQRLRQCADQLQECSKTWLVRWRGDAELLKDAHDEIKRDQPGHPANRALDSVARGFCKLADELGQLEQFARETAKQFDDLPD